MTNVCNIPLKFTSRMVYFYRFNHACLAMTNRLYNNYSLNLKTANKKIYLYIAHLKSVIEMHRDFLLQI